MKFLLQVLFIARCEAKYLSRFPRRLFNMLVIALVPAMYCVLYLTSMWDPEANMAALPVALVNLDAGMQYREHSFNLGWEITTRLEDSGRFGYILSKDEERARQQVRAGELAFALIIPKNFSASAIPGAEEGAGKIVIYTSQGNNFETAAIAKHFAETLGRVVNDNLNERRWALVLSKAAGSQRSIDHLQDTINQLHTKAVALKGEVAQSSTSLRNLSASSTSLNESVREMVTRTKRSGASMRAVEEGELDKLLKNMGDSTNETHALADNTKEIQIDTQQLITMIDSLSNALPKRLDGLEGSAEGLANSVEPVVQIVAPVENSGSAFAANVIPGALWLGAAVAAFLIHIRVMPRHSQFFSNPARVMGKIFIPAVLTVLQTVIVLITVIYFLKIRIVSPWAFATTLMVSSLCFLMIIFSLSKVFEFAGRGIAMFFLALQLSSSGGIFPVELSGALFAQLSPWLPMTWVVQSIRACMFGAYEGAWVAGLLPVLLAGVLAGMVASWVGSWRFVASSKLPPCL